MGVSEEAAVIRRGKSEDVELILALLAYYERPRSYFEPFYLTDPTYRPEHSWVVEDDGRLIAHLRVFDRKVRVGGTELRVAAIGNVITAPDQRGRGLAGRLLEAMLQELPTEGFAYSPHPTPAPNAANPWNISASALPASAPDRHPPQAEVLGNLSVSRSSSSIFLALRAARWRRLLPYSTAL